MCSELYHTGTSVFAKLNYELHCALKSPPTAADYLQTHKKSKYFPFLPNGFDHTQNCRHKAESRLHIKEARVGGHSLNEEGIQHKVQEST